MNFNNPSCVCCTVVGCLKHKFAKIFNKWPHMGCVKCCEWQVFPLSLQWLTVNVDCQHPKSSIVFTDLSLPTQFFYPSCKQSERVAALVLPSPPVLHCLRLMGLTAAALCQAAPSRRPIHQPPMRLINPPLMTQYTPPLSLTRSSPSRLHFSPGQRVRLQYPRSVVTGDEIMRS